MFRIAPIQKETNNSNHSLETRDPSKREYYILPWLVWFHDVRIRVQLPGNDRRRITKIEMRTTTSMTTAKRTTTKAMKRTTRIEKNPVQGMGVREGPALGVGLKKPALGVGLKPSKKNKAQM